MAKNYFTRKIIEDIANVNTNRYIYIIVSLLKFKGK